MENHGRFGNASQIRSAIFNKLSASFDRIQKSGDFCAILYVGIAEEDVIVETQAFDPLRVKATPTGRKRASSHRRRVYILSQNGNAGRRCAVIKGIIR